jgi:tRNA nucleotidyltransferase (CCA-adding enzyme)
MDEVLERIKPTREEEERTKEVSRELLERFGGLAREIDGRLEVRLLGSVSRGTWLRYERDLDFFVLFPLEYSKQRMEEVVEELGKGVLEGLERSMMR